MAKLLLVNPVDSFINNTQIGIVTFSGDTPILWLVESLEKEADFAKLGKLDCFVEGMVDKKTGEFRAGGLALAAEARDGLSFVVNAIAEDGTAAADEPLTVTVTADGTMTVDGIPDMTVRGGNRKFRKVPIAVKGGGKASDEDAL